MPKRREVLADKLMDIANIAVAATIFGQFISGQSFRVWVGIAGGALWLFLYFLAYFYILPQGEGKE